MIRDRNFRQTRRREFDDDGYDPHLREFGATPRFSPSRFETPSGPPVRAVVKWFKPERGFGFVEMTNDAEGNNAIGAINGKDVDGRTLNVNEAKPKSEGAGRSFGGGGRGNGGGGRGRY